MNNGEQTVVKTEKITTTLGYCIMITPWYIAVDSFSPTRLGVWQKYIEFSSLTQLKEVISLDSSLCPCAVRILNNEDSKHNIREEGMSDFFHDLDYLMKRTEQLKGINILAVVRNPQIDCEQAFDDPRFTFKGYDIADIRARMSSLTNCGGFPLAFNNDELSGAGLINDLARASEIQQNLVKEYPKDLHSSCDVWAIWRMESR